MNHKLTWALMGMILSMATTAWGQLPPQFIQVSQDGTPVPDVNKQPFPPNPADSSCWLASASNILAAAGYGIGGPAQLRAQGIYTQLKAAYTPFIGGAPDHAISYWLAWYGKNPMSPEYNPSAHYTDISAEYRLLNLPDYNFLKGELFRNQYVGVQFDSPAHAVTLVGWNDMLGIMGQSIWHDSDRNVGPGGDDSYDNSFTVTWNLLDPFVGTTYLANANGYVTFCPGLNKTQEYVMNYDVAWAPSPSGPMAREAGVKAPILGPVPGWQPIWFNPADPNVSYYPFRLNNEYDALKEKHIELLVDFYGRDVNYLNEDIRLRYINQFGTEVVSLPTAKQLSLDNGQVLFSWELSTQPAWEEILFPSGSYLDYGMLEGKVAWWDVATLCLPQLLGDLNGDDLVNNQDIAPFVLALTDPAAFALAYPNVNLLAVGDINGDQSFNNQDIAPFVSLLTGQGNQLGINEQTALNAIPEPASLGMLAIGGLMLLRRVRRVG